MTQPLTKDNLSVGKFVYYYDYSSDCVIKARILKIYDISVKVEKMFYHSKDDDVTPFFIYIEGDVYIQNLYSSPKEAWKAYEERQEEEIQEYCDSIETIEDLVNFPLQHCIDETDEHCDQNARKAYIIRVDELIFKGKDRIEECSSIQALSR